MQPVKQGAAKRAFVGAAVMAARASRSRRSVGARARKPLVVKLRSISTPCAGATQAIAGGTQDVGSGSGFPRRANLPALIGRFPASQRWYAALAMVLIDAELKKVGKRGEMFLPQIAEVQHAMNFVEISSEQRIDLVGLARRLDVPVLVFRPAADQDIGDGM